MLVRKRVRLGRVAEATGQAEWEIGVQPEEWTLPVKPEAL